MEPTDVLIVGAGLAGLSCAQALRAQGKTVKVLERSAHVGGRCALKAPPGEGPAADLGPVFVHGSDPDFLAWLAGFGDQLLPGWPLVVEGQGAPCQPAAFEPGQRRFGLRTGLRTLAEDLARGVDVVHRTTVTSFRWEAEGFTVNTLEGGAYRARDLVLALALEQTQALVTGHAAIAGLLSCFSSLPSLTVVARYAAGSAAPSWDVAYPEQSKVLLMASRESAKRGSEQGPLFTFQARPAWSAARLEADRDEWAAALVAEAARLWGPWATSPVSLVSHRWKYARLDPSSHLVRPALFDQPGSVARLGLAGDLFDPDGGLQGAWRSGRALAQRLGS